MNNYGFDIRDILETINSSNAILFLGSGSTLLCRKPNGENGLTGNALAKEIIQELNYGKAPDFEPTLMEAAEYYQSYMASGKKGLESFIQKRLYDLQPTVGHYIVSSLPWRAVITTNFDLVIENAWKTGTNEGFCKSDVNLIATEGDLEKYFHNGLLGHYSQEKLQVPLFKPHGSIANHQQVENREKRLILTSKDYYHSELIRQNMYKAITHLMKNCTIIFAGYSLSDYTFRNIFYSIMTEEWGTVPSYSITPVTNELRFGWMKRAMRDNFHTTLLNLSFDSFMLHLLKRQGFVHPALKKKIVDSWDITSSDNTMWLESISLSDFENMPSM